MIIALYIILGIYTILISLFLYGFDRLTEFIPKKNTTDLHFSLIVPFRNEEIYLPKLLNSIQHLDYQREQFECLFVDDDSNDDSVKIIESELQNSGINFQILRNHRRTKSPKKDALTTAIHKSQFEWIITTDADCILPEQWLQTVALFIQEKDADMVVGPVTYESVDFSFLEHFQILDVMSLQGSTLGGFGIGKPFLCNGANLAYKKGAFLKLNGFDGNDNIASGDDIFLFEKFLKLHPEKVRFLKSKSAIVSTFPLKSWSDVIEQRTRWAAKSGSYRLFFTKLVGLIVFLMNLGFIIGLGMMFWKRVYLDDFLFLVSLKSIIDFALIRKTSRYYRGKNKKIRDYQFIFFLYPFFTVFIALRSLFVKYTWKGRKFKK